MLWVQDVLASGSDQGELERLYREQGDRMWRSVFAFAGDPGGGEGCRGRGFRAGAEAR